MLTLVLVTSPELAKALKRKDSSIQYAMSPIQSVLISSSFTAVAGLALCKIPEWSIMKDKNWEGSSPLLAPSDTCSVCGTPRAFLEVDSHHTLNRRAAPYYKAKTGQG